MDFPRKGLERCENTFGAARLVADGDFESLAGAQDDASAARQGSRTDFGTTEVGKNGDWFFRTHRGLANAFDGAKVPIVRAMRKIQTHHVHAGADESLDAPE
jgi:hypothetical protein